MTGRRLSTITQAAYSWVTKEDIKDKRAAFSQDFNIFFRNKHTSFLLLIIWSSRGWHMAWRCPYPARSRSSQSQLVKSSVIKHALQAVASQQGFSFSREFARFLRWSWIWCMSQNCYEADFGLWHQKQWTNLHADLWSIGPRTLGTVTQPVCAQLSFHWDVISRWWRGIMHSDACTCCISNSLYNNSRTTSLQSRHRCWLSQGRSWVYWRPHKFAPQPGMSCATRWSPTNDRLYTESLLSDEDAWVLSCFSTTHPAQCYCPAHWWDLHLLQE